MSVFRGLYIASFVLGLGLTAGCGPEGSGTVEVPTGAKKKMKGPDVDQGDPSVKGKVKAGPVNRRAAR